MTDVNAELVEKYQLMLQQDPKSKVFAPLAEAYRKMGMLQEGVELCLQGIQFHPDLVGGRVALGRLYFDQEKYQEASQHLIRATELSPENILAHSLLGECYLKMKQPKEALKSFKMLLFLSPDESRAYKMIQKLESLTADEYDEDVFAIAPLSESANKVHELEIEEATPLKQLSGDEQEQRRQRDLERFISLADAFLVRNDVERALTTLEDAEAAHGAHPEIIRRLKLIRQRYSDDHEPVSPPPNRDTQRKTAQIEKLRRFQSRIDERRRNA